MTLNTRQRAWLLALLATATVLLANRSNASTLSTWNGTTANWSDPTRWSTNPFYPNNGNGAAEYAAVIGGGTVNLNVDVVLSSLTLNGGTLSGGGNISTGTFALTNSATLSTTGTFNANSVNLEGGLLARDLTLPTTANNTFTSTQIGAGATLTVPVGSTLNFNFPGPGEKEAIGPGTLLNQGTFVKTGNARFYASMPFNNEGLVQVLQSNLRLNNSGTHTGTFEVNGGNLELSGTQTFLPSATISGPSTLVLIGGTSTINSEVVTGSIRMVGGTLAGTGNLHPNSYSLEGGTLARDLSLNASPLNSILSLSIASGSTLTNPLGGKLGATSGTVNGPGQFINQGTITKTGAGTETFSTFANQPAGTVDVQAGKLQLSGVGTQEGTFTVAAGATLAFGGAAASESTLTTNTLITGLGTVSVSGGTLHAPGGAGNNYAGGTSVGSGGRINVSGIGTALGPAAVTIQSGGVVSIGDATNLLSSQALVQAGGTLAVRSEFIPQSLIASTSSGTFGIDLVNFASTVNMSVLGNGSMSLGSSTVGSYSASTLEPGTGDTYRLGGGGGTITLTQQNVLTGDRPVVFVGPGTVVLPNAQNYTQGTTIQSGIVAVGSTGSLGVGPVTVQGGGFRADGGPITLGNDVSWAGNATLGGSHDLTLSGATQLTGNRTLNVTNTATTTISQAISEAGGARRLTKDGPGTLVLAGDNTFTGGLTVRGGTVLLNSDQHYGGNTTVDLGSHLVLNGDLLGGGNVSVVGGSTLSGNGAIAGALSIGNTSTLGPGSSPGVITVGNGLTLQNGSHIDWELGALGTLNPGLDWDQLVVTGGPLQILAGAKLDVSFVQSAVAPGSDVFWSSFHRWNNVINLTGAATNPTGFVDFQIDNSHWSQYGTFDTLAAQSGNGVDLIWNPVPEPSTWMLLVSSGAALCIVGRRRLRTRAPGRRVTAK